MKTHFLQKEQAFRNPRNCLESIVPNNMSIQSLKTEKRKLYVLMMIMWRMMKSSGEVSII